MSDVAGSPMSEEEKEEGQAANRKRSATGSMMVYHPKDHGDNESLPAVMVIDTTTAGAEDEGQGSPGGSGPVDGEYQGGGRILTHTARPPVELMEHT